MLTTALLSLPFGRWCFLNLLRLRNASLARNSLQHLGLALSLRFRLRCPGSRRLGAGCWTILLLLGVRRGMGPNLGQD